MPYADKVKQKEACRINMIKYRAKMDEGRKEQQKEQRKEYHSRAEVKERKKEYQKEYFRSPCGKIAMKRFLSKRKRDMGFVPLNDMFPGCEAHHIDCKQVIHIPKELHRKYPHNHRKPDTMTLINVAAWDYLYKHA